MGADRYWDAPGSPTPSGNWDGINLYWSDNSAGGGNASAVVGTANTAVFSANTTATGIYTVTVNGTQSVQGLRFEEGTPTLAGGIIALDASASSGDGNALITANSTLSGPATVSSGLLVNTTASNTLLKMVANNGAAATDLIIDGPITTTVPANAYQLRLGGAGNGRIATNLGSGSAIFNGLQQGAATWSGIWTIAGNQTWTGSGADITLSSSASFSSGARLVMGDSTADIQSWRGIIMNNATPVLAINSTATLSGNTAISRSRLEVAGSLSGGVLSMGTNASVAGTLKLSDGTTAGSATFSGTGTFSGANKITGGAAGVSTLTFNTAGTATLSGNVTLGGAGTNENNLQLVKQGAGTLVIAGSHTYTGNTTVNAGSLNLTGTIASPITINAGATLRGEGSTGGLLTFGAGGSNLIFDSSTEPGAFTADSISAAGASVLLTPSGATTINATYTVLKQVTGTFSGNASDSFIAATRGTLAFANANKDLTLTPTEAAALVWTGANGTNPTFWDVATTVNWTNGGSPDRFYANDAVTFNDAASSFSVAVQGSSVSPGNIVIDNSASDYTFSGGGIAGPGSFTKNGTGTATIGNALTNAGGIVVNAGTLTLNAANNFGSGGVTINAGALNLNAANSFTGNLTVNGGTLTATTGGLGTLALARPITLNGGTLNYTGTTLSSDVLAFAISGNNSLAASAAGQTLRSGGPLTGSGNLDIAGPGIVAFGKNSVATLGSTYNGTLTVKSGGTLDIRNPDSMGATGTGSGTIVEAGGQLLINPFNQAAGVVFDAETIAFQGASNLVNWNQSTTAATTNTLTGAVSTAGTLTVSSLSSGGAPTLAINATISGAGGVTFGGTGQAGTYVLNSTNSFNGPTTVTSGTLVLSGTGTIAASAVSVNGNGTASGTLSGSGSVGGPVTVNAFGHLRAGIDSLDVATLTLSGGLSTLADSLIEIGLGADASTHDILALSGSSSFQANQAFRFLDQGAVAGVTYTGLITGIDSGLNVSGWTVTNAGWTGIFTNNSGALNFELSAIPEPRALALAAGGFAFLALVRRFRRTGRLK